MIIQATDDNRATDALYSTAVARQKSDATRSLRFCIHQDSCCSKFQFCPL